MLPDIDIVIQPHGRRKIVRHLVAKYGADHIAQAVDYRMFGHYGATKGAARSEAESIWRDCENAAPNVFLKCHAICVALNAYRSAYLKTHWAKEWKEAVS